MAYDRNDSGASNNTSSNRDASWKADYFLNVSIPANTESGKRQIGGIGLKLSKADHKQLIEYLQADPANAEKLVKVMTLELRSADGDSDSLFNLPV